MKGPCRLEELLGQDLGRALAGQPRLSLQPARLDDAHLVDPGVPFVGMRLRIAQHRSGHHQKGDRQDHQVPAQPLDLPAPLEPDKGHIARREKGKQARPGVEQDAEAHHEPGQEKGPVRCREGVSLPCCLLAL